MGIGETQMSEPKPSKPNHEQRLKKLEDEVKELKKQVSDLRREQQNQQNHPATAG
jgi:hypothetical protein